MDSFRSRFISAPGRFRFGAGPAAEAATQAQDGRVHQAGRCAGVGEAKLAGDLAVVVAGEPQEERPHLRRRERLLRVRLDPASLGPSISAGGADPWREDPVPTPREPISALREPISALWSVGTPLWSVRAAPR